MHLIVIGKGRLNRVAQEDVYIACVDGNFDSVNGNSTYQLYQDVTYEFFCTYVIVLKAAT